MGTPCRLAMLALLMIAVVDAPAEARPAKTVFEQDVVFSRVENVELKMDIARPTSSVDRGHPALIVLHGGGWAAGRRQWHHDIVRYAATKGWVAATIDYRLAPTHPWPAQIQDAQQAVRFLRTHHERFGLDPARIAAMGFSAGGHLALLLGTVEASDRFGLPKPDNADAEAAADVQAVVAFFPPTDLPALADRFDTPLRRRAAQLVLDQLLGAAYAADRDRASPISYLDPNDAPTLLFHGTKDPLVPFQQARAYVDRATELRVNNVELMVYAGAQHGWRDPRLSASVRLAENFLARQLRPETLPALPLRFR